MILFTNLIEEDYRILQSAKISIWINQVIETEGNKCGEINYIFVKDAYLLEINKKYLQHDTYTDIITFPESFNSNIITGEIFISLDRVLENAKKFEVDISDEFKRVLVHGILHLLGYNDKTDEEKKIMRAKEDYYINLQASTFVKLFHVKHQ